MTVGDWESPWIVLEMLPMAEAQKSKIYILLIVHRGPDGEDGLHWPIVHVLREHNLPLQMSQCSKRLHYQQQQCSKVLSLAKEQTFKSQT